jgi:hypothetical protein
LDRNIANSTCCNSPAPIVFGIILFGIIHAYFFGWLSVAWPEGVFNRSRHVKKRQLRDASPPVIAGHIIPV